MAVDIIIGHLGRPRSTHTAPMPVLMGSVHAHIITKPSRAGLPVSPSELVEPGAATCAVRGIAGPCLKSLEHIYLPSTSTSIIHVPGTHTILVRVDVFFLYAASDTSTVRPLD